MSWNEAFQALGAKLGVSVEIFSGKVSDVDTGKYSVNVQLGDDPDDLILTGIKLRSVISGDEKSGFVCVPKVGSYIIFCKVDGQTDYVLISSSELDKVILEIDTVKMTIDKTGYQIAKGNISLIDVFSDLKSLLENFKVNTPSGPSAGILPDTISALNALETKFNDLLK